MHESGHYVAAGLHAIPKDADVIDALGKYFTLDIYLPKNIHVREGTF